MTTPTPPHQAMSSALVVLILSLLLGLQPLATDLYLPALPGMTDSLGAPVQQAQLTLSVMLLAFGTSQLVWGPLSDRYGRRPVLLWGMSAHVLASIGCVLAGSMEQLIAWRALQGVAMGAAVMCARAIVRDLYAPVDGARMMSRGLTGLGVFACISAPLGGLLSDLLGWRATLSALAVFGSLTLWVVAWRFRETLPQRNVQALQPLQLWRTWRGIMRHPTFWAYAALVTTSYAGLFTFLATSPFVFIQVLGVSKPHYGLLMFSMSLVYIVGTLICRRLIPRLGVKHTVALAAASTLTGGTVLGLLPLFGVHGIWAIMLPYYLFILAHGIHQPCGQSGCVAPFPQAAGAASALSGFIMMLVAFGMGRWLGAQLQSDAGHGVEPLTHGLWFWSSMIALTAWTLVQRHGELHTPPQRLTGTSTPGARP